MAESTRAAGAFALERRLERERVHHRRQHAHIVGARPVHAALRRHQPAKDVAAADHEADLGARRRPPRRCRGRSAASTPRSMP